MKIKVLVYRPGETGTAEEIENELEPMQELVGGYIETVNLGNGLLLVCNEEGKLQGLPANRRVGHEIIVGNFFVTRADGEGEFVSMNARDFAQVRAMLG